MKVICSTESSASHEKQKFHGSGLPFSVVNFPFIKRFRPSSFLLGRSRRLERAASTMNITAKTSTDTVATPTAVCFSRRDFSDPVFAVVVFGFADVDDGVVVGVVVVGVVVVGDVAAGDESDVIDNFVERPKDDPDVDESKDLLELVESVGLEVKLMLVFSELLSVVVFVGIGVVVSESDVVVVVVVVVVCDVDVNSIVDDAVEVDVVVTS